MSSRRLSVRHVVALFFCSVVALWVLAAPTPSHQKRSLWRSTPARGQLNLDGIPLVDAMNLQDTAPALSSAALNVYVMTMSRPSALRRLVDSLQRVDWAGDTIALHFLVDTPRQDDEARIAKLSARQQCIDLAKGTEWRFGPKRLVLREWNKGLAEQWLTAFVPKEDGSEDDARALILEDDLEVSPFAYRWLKGAYEAYGQLSHVVGISLQRQHLIPKDGHGRALKVDNGNQPFLYQLPGSWGFAPIAREWRKFLSWRWSRPQGFVPAVPGLITTRWYQSHASSGRTDKMWTQWLIRYCDEEKKYTLYANAKGGVTLCANWREQGEHYTGDAQPSPDYPLALQEPPGLYSYPSSLLHLDWAARPIVSAPDVQPDHAVVPSASERKPDFHIFVLTYKRAKSLRRLLNALIAADYAGDTIALTISVDWPSGGETPQHQEVVSVSETFQWPHGPKNVIKHSSNQGIVRQWVYTWLPETDTERAAIFEDDLEPSPVYYRWLKKAHDTYGHLEEIIGISLQTQYLVPKKGSPAPPNPKNGNQPFLYRLLGTWGYSPVARQWRKFQDWMRSLPDNFDPTVRGLVTSDWYRAAPKSMWTQHFIYYCDRNLKYTLYPAHDLPNKATLCSNWQEPGLHFSGKAKGPDHPRLLEWVPELDRWPTTLVKLDWGNRKEGEVAVR